MAVSFKKEPYFSKGIVNAEFFDISTDNLIGYSAYVTNFALNGTINNGEVEAGPGNMLVMAIPDSARLAITCQTADTDLNSLALPVGGTVTGNGVIETVVGVTADSTSLTLSNAVAPKGGQNGAICYILTSSGADKADVEMQSGIAHAVADGGAVSDFTAVPGNTYCVKMFVENSSALMLDIPALFAPKIVRAHFAVNLYAKKTGSDVMESSIVAIRHYYIPYYFFTAGLQDTASQTTTGTVDLSGMALTYEQAIESGNCASVGQQSYGFIVDELLGSNSATSLVDGLFFIGGSAGFTVAQGESIALPIKYSVKGVLTNISNMSDVTFSSDTTAKVTVEGNVATGVATGSAIITASVTNAATNKTYSDSIKVTVVSA